MERNPHDLQRTLDEMQQGLRNQAERLQAVCDVGHLLSSNWDLQQIFPRISESIRRALRHEFASFVLHDPKTELLVRQAIDFPLGKGLIEAAHVVTSKSPSGLAMQERVIKIFSKEDLLGMQEEVASSMAAEGLESVCCIPLMRPGGALGVLVVGSTRQNAFRDEDMNLLGQVAAQLALAIENHRAALELQQLKERLSEERRYLEGGPPQGGDFPELIGDSNALKQVLDQVLTVATSDETVMILGETGTGKELIARAIHQMSRRKLAPFMKVNCAAIPMGLLESELFGHEKGAFTGAVTRKIGRMEVANGGTLFLDEVGEIPMELQPKLLRVLQDQEFERLGSTQTRKVNVRILTATNRNLEERVSEREFRSDLFYRLNVFPIRMPALRERRQDIPLLVRHFVHKFADRMGRYIETIPRETMNTLTEWNWPGNVRELENLMERSVILSEGTVLRVPLEENKVHNGISFPGKDHTLDNTERQHIIRVLRETHGVISGPNGAAQRLGLKRTTLQSKMQRLGITRGDYLSSSKG
jgi:formate hydrogenlyase transcriptional activator